MIEVKNKILYFFFQFYCLPDNYEVIDSSLDDIKVSLNFNNWISFMPSVCNYSHKLLLIKLLNLKSQKIVWTNAISLPIVSF